MGQDQKNIVISIVSHETDLTEYGFSAFYFINSVIRVFTYTI